MRQGTEQFSECTELFEVGSNFSCVKRDTHKFTRYGGIGYKVPYGNKVSLVLASNTQTSQGDNEKIVRSNSVRKTLY